MEFEYIATQTASRFHMSDAYIRLLMGPVGCGKTVALCVELMLLAYAQPKSLRDGKRKSKIIVVRNTYGELLTTTIDTWLACFPEQYWGKMHWSVPITHSIRAGDVEADIIFMSLNSQSDLGKIMSLNATHAAVNEARFIPYCVIEGLKQRIGRYPDEAEGSAPPKIIMDTNPPNEQHWIYKLFEIDKPNNHEIFRYPPAIIKKQNGDWEINPHAENVDKIGAAYYLRQIDGASREHIKVFLEGQYGTIVSGRPVYTEYNDALHYVDKTQVIVDAPIALGWDFGLTPAVVICQLSPSGRLIIHEEITSISSGITQFVDTQVLPKLNRDYPNWKHNYVSFGDPAGNQRAQTDEKTCFEILMHKQIITRAASTNTIVARQEAVNYFLTRLIEGKPALALSNKCPLLRTGFLGAYHYPEITIANEQAFKPEPVKNACSHPHDALQYIALYFAQLAQAAQQQVSDRPLSNRIY